MPEPIEVVVDGIAVEGFCGETVAGLLMRAAQAEGLVPCGYFCGMGARFACIVAIDGRPVQACLTPVAHGMRIAITSALAINGPAV